MRTHICCLFALASVLTSSASAIEAPFTVSILGNDGIVDIRSWSRIEIANRTSEPIKIWDPRTAEGSRALSFLFIHRESKRELIARPAERNEMPFDNYGWTSKRTLSNPRNRVIEIAANDSFHFYFSFAALRRDEMPDVREIGDWDLQALYQPVFDRQSLVTQGNVRSKPFAGKLTCVGLDKFESALPVSDEIAVELLESQSEEIDKSPYTGLRFLWLAISNNRPQAVRWLVQHQVSPFREIERGLSEPTGEERPAARIRHVETLKVLWDELPGRRNELLQAVSQRAERELAEVRDSDSNVDYRFDYRPLLREMLKWGAEPDLFTAIHLGDFIQVKSILSKSAFLPTNSKRWNFSSPIAWAVVSGQSEIARWMIEQYSPDLNADYGQYPYRLASFDGEHRSLLQLAVNDAKMTKLLCEFKAEFQTRKKDEPADIEAIENPGVAQPPVQSENFLWYSNNGSALNFAAKYGTPEVVTILLDHGAELKFVKGQIDPLSIAIEGGNRGTYDAILAHPRCRTLSETAKQAIAFNVNSITNGMSLFTGSTDKMRNELLAIVGSEPRSDFANIEDVVASVRHPIEKAADYDEDLSPVSQTIWLAIERKRIDIIERICEAGYELTNERLFEYAVRSGYLEGLKYFATQFPDKFKVRTHELLLIAADQCEFEIVRWLLEQGAPITAINSQGDNALKVANRAKYKVVSAEVERLIQKTYPE